MDAESFFAGLFGTIVGGTITTVFNVWKLRRDEFLARTDELCLSIKLASGQALEYWSVDYSELEKPRIVEAKLRAAQSDLDAAYGSWRQRVYEDDGKKVDDALSELLDALTGGTFSQTGRMADHERVDQGTLTSVNCISAIRDAHRKTIPLQGFFDRYIRSRNTQPA